MSDDILDILTSLFLPETLTFERPDVDKDHSIIKSDDISDILTSLLPETLTFERPDVDRAVYFIKLFIKKQHISDWHHVKIRRPALDSFTNLMNKHYDRSRTLPFSCWCNGGSLLEAALHQHRHFIVVSCPKGYFDTNILQHIRPARSPNKQYPYVYVKRITSAMHLVNTIGSLSTLTTRCRFNSQGPEKPNHFYIQKELCRSYRLPCVLQWDGGILELLDREYRDLDAIDPSAFEFVRNKWRIQIQNLPGDLLKKTVLPVRAGFRLSQNPTCYFVHLVEGRKMYFDYDINYSRLTREEWLHKQVNDGNLFYYVVRNDYWTPGEKHQRWISATRQLPTEPSGSQEETVQQPLPSLRVIIKTVLPRKKLSRKKHRK